MHQIQAMQAGKICFDLYFQPLITNSKKIDCWKEPRSEMLGLIFLFFLLPLYQFLSSLTHGNWQPRISRRWPLRKGLYSLFHLIFMWWCNKLSKKCSTELCMEQTMCARFKSSFRKKYRQISFWIWFPGQTPLIQFPLSWCCTSVLFCLKAIICFWLSTGLFFFNCSPKKRVPTPYKILTLKTFLMGFTCHLTLIGLFGE